MHKQRACPHIGIPCRRVRRNTGARERGRPRPHSIRRPIVPPVSITQIRRPNLDRLGAAKNRRAPARAGKGNGVGSAAVPGRINTMTDRTTRFDYANPASDHSPAGGGQEWPRSCTRWKRQRLGSAAVLGRINTTTDPAPVSITQILRPTIHRLGAGKNARAPAGAFEKTPASGARPSSAASTRRPILHQFRSHKSCVRPFTGWGRPRMAALLHAVEKATASGARPSSAASTR